MVNRLSDKKYSWHEAVELLIPEMITAGLLGHAYSCPDMIGGGLYTTFADVEENGVDQDLIVRSCQTHALMPMMQFSIAPWRVLDSTHLEACRKGAELHQKMGGYILSLARESAQTGEPILRHMEYEFPHQGFERCEDQFMLGDKYLVAPVINKEGHRTVLLPQGVWKDDTGQEITGPQTIEMDVPLERLPYYERIR